MPVSFPMAVVPQAWSCGRSGDETGGEVHPVDRAGAIVLQSSQVSSPLPSPQEQQLILSHGDWQLGRDLPHTANGRPPPLLPPRATGGDGGFPGRPVERTSGQTDDGVRRQHEWAAEIRTCTDVLQGKELHARILGAGGGSNVYLCNLLLHMFGRCGSILDARRVFANISRPNDYSWTMLIDASVRNGQVEAAKQALHAMPRPNVVAWTLLVQAYASQGQHEAAKATFEAMPDRNIVSWTALLSGYASSGNVEAAGAVFEAMPQHNLVSWNALLAAYAAHGYVGKAQGVYDTMPEHNLQSWCSMMSSYNESGHCKRAMALFEQMPCRDVVAWNSLLRAHIVSGNLGTAIRSLMVSMPQHNLVSWNTVMTALVQHGAGVDKVAGLFYAIPVWDAVTINSMLTCYSRAEMLREARELFDAFGKGWPDLVLQTTMFVAYAQGGHLEEAKVLFDAMPYCTLVSWNAMVVAYAQHEDVDGAQRLFDQAPARNVATWNALLSMYAQSGHLFAARNTFDVMPARDRLSWNTMLAAYAYVGGDVDRCRRAMELVTHMAGEGMLLDEVSFLCLLVVCNHVGLLLKGCHYLASMVYDHGLQPRQKHYNAVVGVLGRSGQVSDAELVVKRMSPAADAVSWTALLGACHIHSCRQQLIRAREAAEKVVALEPHNLHLLQI